MIKYDTAVEFQVDHTIAMFLEEEYAAKGDKLYIWYRNSFLAANNPRLTASIGLAPKDKAIARFVVERCDFATRFVEIGAGVGQASMLLARLGLPAFAVETSHVNFDMMMRARDYVSQRLDPELPERMTPISDFFPVHASEYVNSKTVLAFPSLSFGIDAEMERKILDALPLAGGVILSLTWFFKARDHAEQESLIAQIRAKGFDAPVEVYSWADFELGFSPDRIVFMKRL